MKSSAMELVSSVASGGLLDPLPVPIAKELESLGSGACVLIFATWPAQDHTDFL